MASIDTATGQIAKPDISTQRVHQIFSKIARKYELFNAVSSFGAYKLWLSKLVSSCNITPTDTVLDVAGGTGDVTFAVAEKLHPKRILCTDLVPEMLEVAQDHYVQGRGNGTDIVFEVADAQALQFDDESFDLVTMAYGLRNMPERERALSEMYRVLKPGGKLVCLDFSTPKNPAWRSLYRFYLDHMIPFWGKLIAGNTEDFVYLSQSIKAFPNQKGVAALMEDAGFANVEWKDCMGGIACIHVAHKEAIT